MFKHSAKRALDSEESFAFYPAKKTTLLEDFSVVLYILLL